MKYFDKVIVVGTHQKEWFEKQGFPKQNIHLIPCGVPTDDFIQHNKTNHNNVIRFICISRLVEKKGLEYTIKAFDKISNTIEHTELNIYGDGPLEKTLKTTCRQIKP